MAGLFSRTWEQMNRPRREEDLKATASRVLIDRGVRPSSLRTSDSESTEDVVGKWNAAVAAEAQAIKESRDPKLRRKQQLASKEANISKADEALKSKGIAPEDFWISEPGLEEKSFTERTGKKIGIPEEAQVGAVSRELNTPEGGMYRQIAGSQGTGTVYFPPEAAKAIAGRRADEESRAIKYQQALAAAGKARVARDQERGQKVKEKFAQWEADKKAFEEGKQLQSYARRRISRINRALREDNRFQQRWERGAGYGTPMSAEQYNALLDEKAMLQNTLARREGLKDKEITGLGRQAEKDRQARIAQAENIRRSNEARVAAAQYGVTSTQQQAQVADPFRAAIDQYYNSAFSDFNVGFGIPGVTYPGFFGADNKPKK